VLSRESQFNRKDAKSGIHAGLSCADTHLIPEVRPLPGYALRYSKTLPAFLSRAQDALLTGLALPLVNFFAACEK